MNAVIGQPIPRVDGPAKVTGQATYAAEFRLPGLCHAAVVLSTIPRGRIARIDTTAAAGAPGVLAVLTHRERAPAGLRAAAATAAGGPEVRRATACPAGRPRCTSTASPSCCVVAETLEQATHGGELVRVEYRARVGQRPNSIPRVADRRANRPPRPAAPAIPAAATPMPRLLQRRSVSSASYRHPREHHNAIEPHATIAHWEGEHLTLHDKTQWVDNDRKEIAARLRHPGGPHPGGLALRRRRLRLRVAHLAACDAGGAGARRLWDGRCGWN